MGIKKHSENNKLMSDKYMIACEIYHQNASGNEIWFNKLVDIFGDSMKVNTISDSIDELFEMGMISSGRSKKLDQYKGVVFYIAPDYIGKVTKCYNSEWKNIREKWLMRAGFVTEHWD